MKVLPIFVFLFIIFLLIVISFLICSFRYHLFLWLSQNKIFSKRFLPFFNTYNWIMKPHPPYDRTLQKIFGKKFVFPITSREVLLALHVF